MHDRKVMAATEDGQSEVIVETTDMPAGLGWLPDGRLLVVSVTERKLLRLDPEGLVEVADLSDLAPFHCNDMVVDDQGRAYSTTLVCVDPDGEAWVAIEQLLFPNGSVITDSGHTLVVAESFGQRLSAYEIQADGSLGNGRVWADLRPNVPDGICLDAAGAIWVADPINNGVMRVIEGAGPVEWIPTDRGAFACVLGGADGRTLFVCTADSSDPAKTVTMRSGRIEVTRVDVPAAG